MEDPIKNDRGALDMIQHKLESAPVSIGMENINTQYKSLLTKATLDLSL